MAKKSDKSAGALDADKAGLLTGLFAEENEFEPRSLWRIGTWGVAAVGAIVLAVTSNQWSLGIKRDRLAAADLSRQAQQIQSLTKDSRNETRRLAAAIDTLNNDRDRLFSRVTMLEQGLDSVTGTIAKQTAAAAIAASTTPKPAPSVAPPPATLMAATAPPADKPPPAASSPSQPGQAIPPLTQASTTVASTTAVSSPAEKPRTDAAKPDSAATIASLPQIAAIKPAVPLAPAAAPARAPASAAAPGAPKSMSASPDPSVPKLVEAAKAAEAAPAAPTLRTAAKAPAAATAPPDAGREDKARDRPEEKDQENAPTAADGAKIQRTEFAVELGGANSIPGLRALWRGLMKSNKAELGELRPIIVLREGTNGLGMQLRLAAGPLQNAAEAARICAGLAERKRTCETTVFDGQRLAMGADEKPAASGKQPAAATDKPPSHRHYYPRHAKKEEPPPPPPKPESSTFSSLFGFNKH